MMSLLRKCWCPNQQRAWHDASWFPKFLQISCLKPNYTLRRQLVAGYGITAFVTLFIVVAMASISAHRAGSIVREESNALFQTQLDDILQRSGVLTGDILDKKMESLRGSVNLLAEIVRDRIVGYPNDGWETDRHLPFVNVETGKRFYPIKANLLPRDFEIRSNLDASNGTNLKENLQERGGEHVLLPFLNIWNTESAMFSFQGNCDPDLTNPTEPGYYPFCSEENNDASLGGKINPTKTLAPLEQKAADVGVFAKAIFEAQPLALSVGVVFVNSGAGAGMAFPSFAATPGLEYTSAGCEWMREINPLTDRPYGTQEEINRCSPIGTRLSIREYNGLERPWCADQALNPGETRIFGPYASTTYLSWRLTVGKAVFDRLTNELIGCTHIDLSLVQAEHLLADIAEDMPSDMVVTRTDGTVVVGASQKNANGNSQTTSLTPKLWETDFIDLETYKMLTDNLAFWEGKWDIASAQNKYNFSVYSNGNYFSVFPSPIPPDEYDPLYKPDFFIFGSIDAEEQDNKIDEIDEIITSDVNGLIAISVILGIIGLLLMMVVIIIFAKVLTRPLQWMEDKAQEIVNHTEKEAGEHLIVANDDDDMIHFFRFAPKTEVHDLVTEFRSMISGFSGKGASHVAVPRHNETKNHVTWKEDFRKFYNLSPNLEHKIKEEMNMMTRSVSRRMSKKSAMRAGSFRRTSMRRASTRRSAVRKKGSFRNTSFRNLNTSSHAELNESKGSWKDSSWKDNSFGDSQRSWNNSFSPSVLLTNSDFEQILAAYEEAETETDPIISEEEESSQPVFQSTQMSGESTTERKSITSSERKPPKLSTASFLASATLTSSSRERSAKAMGLRKTDSEHFPRPATRINLGSNIQHDADERRLSLSSKRGVNLDDDDDDGIKITRSPLYWNVLCWIAFPLLAAIAAIMITVGFQLIDKFPKWINEANMTSFDLEVEHLKSSTTLVKKHMEQIFVQPIHDLYTIQRISGWLLFGAMNQSDGFTDIEMELAEECKYFDDISKCTFLTNENRSPCPCAWNDPWVRSWDRTCSEDDGNETLASDPRYQQKLWYLNQVRKEDEVYPEVNFSPNSTSWYTDPFELPGSDSGTDAEQYLTNYDRARVASTLSSIIFPVYNHGTDARADGPSASSMSGYISFEASGEYGGFSGCNYDAAGYAHFQSSDVNNAHKISDFCPKGQFGYDPRCRGWYDSAKQHALATDGGMYITPPYKYATSDEIGITAVAPLIDPKTGEFVGNNLLDFTTTEISQVFDKTKVNIYAVILPNTTDGQNVISSTESTDKSAARSIHDLLEPDDPDRLEEIIQEMENEGTGANCDLNRTDQNGVHQTCYAYEPLYVRELRTVRANDFSAGAVHSRKFHYSLMMVQDVDDMSSEFMKRSDDISRVLIQTYVIYMITTGIATLICIIVTAKISLYITKPVIQLLRTVKQVNDGGIGDDMPPLTGGNREVHQVYASFAKLYKTVRMSNSAFFLGDLALAHRIAADALRLFRKIGDQKAIAIACNNMGNTLLAWMVECRDPGTSLELEGDDCSNCTEAAIKYYNQAVSRGTKDFEEATGDADKAQFAQQLADRHFNRAMCLLLTADDPVATSDAKETALDDLFLVKQYDHGVKEYMLHSKTLLENSDVIFERSVRRLHGLATLIDVEPEVWDVWDIYELVDQADLMLQAAWNQEEAPLFHNTTKIGRLQELEGAVTGIELASGKANDALQLATRMLIEDEFLLDSSFIEAADCILQCAREDQENADDDDDDDDEKKETSFHEACITELTQEFKTMRKPGMRNCLDIGRAFVFCIDLKGEWNGQRHLTQLRRALLSFYEENFQANDTVGIVTFVPKDGTLKKVQPSSLKDLLALDMHPHKDALVAATTGVACSRFIPALRGGIEMALDVESQCAKDVCLMYVTDGGAYNENIYNNLRDKLETSSRAENSRIRASSRTISVASSIDLVILDLAATREDLSNSQDFHESRSSRFMLPEDRQGVRQIVRQLSGKQIAPPKVTFADNCRSLITATRSRASIYIEVDPDNLDDAFAQASASINEGTSFDGNRLQRALTMQKF